VSRVKPSVRVYVTGPEPPQQVGGRPALPVSKPDAVNPPPGEVAVVWNRDPEANRAWRDAVGGSDRVVVVNTEKAAVGARAALERGESVASLVYPPFPVVERVLEEAGLGPDPADPPERWELEAAGRTASGADPNWLELTPGGVRVDPSDLDALERAALAERCGLPKESGGRLLIGRANHAGQGRAWAQAVTDHVPGFTAANLVLRFTSKAWPFDSDCLADYQQMLRPLTRVDLALDLLAPATHVLIEDMGALLGAGPLREPDFFPAAARAEAERLASSGRRVAFMVHGSAGRDTGRHRRLEPFSPFAEAASRDSLTGQLQALVESVVAALDGFDGPLFTATPDMLDHLPTAHWVPIAASRDDFAPSPPWAAGGKLRVAHLPSSGPLKGSRYVDQAMRRLQAAGVIEYVAPGHVPPQAVPRLIRSVDVVVDQVVLGNSATLVIQTQAAGRLAVGHVTPASRRRFPEPPPLVEADPTDLVDVIADIAADPERYRPLAEAGPGFARRYHDGRMSAEVLRQHFLEPNEDS
jgi:hypothetical protein